MCPTKFESYVLKGRIEWILGIFSSPHHNNNFNDNNSTNHWSTVLNYWTHIRYYDSALSAKCILFPLSHLILTTKPWGRSVISPKDEETEDTQPFQGQCSSWVAEQLLELGLSGLESQPFLPWVKSCLKRNATCQLCHQDAFDFMWQKYNPNLAEFQSEDLLAHKARKHTGEGRPPGKKRAFSVDNTPFLLSPISLSLLGACLPSAKRLFPLGGEYGFWQPHIHVLLT